MTDRSSTDMYARSASFYDAYYHFLDYEGAAQYVEDVISEQLPGARTLLDVACGTGQHLHRFGEHFDVEGLDLNEDMLTVARQRCPGVTFHLASMVDFALPRRFDVVTCMFGSIGYVQTVGALREAVAAMARHLEPGGLLLIEPWFEPDRYWTGTVTANNYDTPDFKVTRMYTSKREDLVSVLDIHYLVGTPERIEHFVEEHRVGLFTRSQYEGAMEDAGLTAVAFDPKGPWGRGLYVGRAPAHAQAD